MKIIRGTSCYHCPAFICFDNWDKKKIFCTFSPENPVPIDRSQCVFDDLKENEAEAYDHDNRLACVKCNTVCACYDSNDHYEISEIIWKHNYCPNCGVKLNYDKYKDIIDNPRPYKKPSDDKKAYYKRIYDKSNVLGKLQILFYNFIRKFKK
jgi:ribosomal protein S27AE